LSVAARQSWIQDFGANELHLAVHPISSGSSITDIRFIIFVEDLIAKEVYMNVLGVSGGLSCGELWVL